MGQSSLPSQSDLKSLLQENNPPPYSPSAREGELNGSLSASEGESLESQNVATYCHSEPFCKKGEESQNCHSEGAIATEESKSRDISGFALNMTNDEKPQYDKGGMAQYDNKKTAQYDENTLDSRNDKKIESTHPLTPLVLREGESVGDFAREGESLDSHKNALDSQNDKSHADSLSKSPSFAEIDSNQKSPSLASCNTLKSPSFAEGDLGGGLETTQNKDISLHATRSTQYDKNTIDSQTHITSLTHTHTFNKTYKDITNEQISSHFTLVDSNFITSDLVKIGDFITQELPRDALIHFVDSDDYLEVECIENCVQNLQSGNLDIFAHNMKELNEASGEIKEGRLWKLKAKQSHYASGLEMLVDNRLTMFCFSCQGLFRAQILNRYALRFTEGIYHEDHDFGTLLFCLANKVAYSDYAPYIYRARPNSTMTSYQNTDFPKNAIFFRATKG